MPILPQYVSDNARPKYKNPFALSGRPIHDIFRQEAFRNANYSDCLSLPELGMEAFDLPDVLYHRMKPALRLATQLIRFILPDLARIRYANIIKQVVDARYEDRVLADSWTSTPADINRLQREVLIPMCKDYRITILNSVHSESARTRALINHSNRYRRIYPQTGLDSQWFRFLSRPDFATIPKEEKCGKYFLLAVSLVQELAHAVFLDRVLAELPHDDDVNAEEGEFALQETEPRCFSHGSFEELGYAMAVQLFGGIPGLSHFGTPTSVERDCGEGESYRVLFSTIDAEGRVVDVHQISKSQIFSFFQVERNEIWSAKHRHGYAPYIEMELLENDGPPRRRMSTVLSSPLPMNNDGIPTVKMPDPRALKPAITADNELFLKDYDRSPRQQKRRSRSLSMRVRALFPFNRTRR